MSEPDLIVRASSLADWLDCPERWRSKYLLGKSMPSGSAAHLGTSIHRGTAVFDTKRMEDGIASVEDAVDAAVEAVKNPREEVRWDDFRPAEAIDIAARLTNEYCQTISPQFTYKKVEMKLDPLDVIASNGIVVRFTGQIDRERERDGMLGVIDVKTGKQVIRPDGSVNTQMSGAQLATYELLSLMATNTLQSPHILPAMIIAMPTAGKARPAFAEIKNPHKMLIGDEQNKGAIDIISEMYKSDSFYGNARSMYCSERLCPNFHGCRWRLTAEAE